MYIHVPFCVRRCLYCDFITYAGQQAWLPAYVEAAIKEIHWLGSSTGKTNEPDQTVYFGGGTPSLLSIGPVSYTHLRAHETPEHLVFRLLLSTTHYTQHESQAQ